jgi:hypothetical protein
MHPVQKTMRGRRVMECAILQGFGKGFESSQRCTQFMGEIADEVTPYGFETAQPSEILNEKQAAAQGMTVRDHNELQELAARRDFNRVGLHLTAIMTALPGLDQLVMAKNLRDGTTKEIFAEDFFRGRIGELNTANGISDQHPVGDLVEHCRKARAFSFGSGELIVNIREE